MSACSRQTMGGRDPTGARRTPGRPAWQMQPARKGCAALFFPEVTDDQTVAVRICAGCHEGIWGAQNGRDRRKLRTGGRRSPA
jgi:hypothetical protein